MGAWRKGVVIGRGSAGRRKKKAATFVVLNRKSMERKLRQLQRIIPGGETDMDTLFHRIATHIVLLESRVDLLRNIFSVISPP